MRTRGFGGGTPPSLLLALAVALGFAGFGSAQDGVPKPPYDPPGWPAAPTGGQLVGRLALLTCGTGACAAAVVWLARRQRRAAGLLPGPAPRVVAKVALAGRCALHLLQVDGAGFVVATDAGGLKAIQPLTEPFADLVEQQAEEGPADPGFGGAPPPTLPCPLAPRRVG